MKNTRREVIGLLIFAVFVYATGYLYQKSQEPSAVEKLQEGMEVYFITIETLEGQEFKTTK